ncbi:unnamed protein product, partial [Didymodactylos carnosus]
TAWKYDSSKSLTYKRGQKNATACFADSSCLQAVFNLDTAQAGGLVVKQQYFGEIASSSGKVMENYSDVGVCGLRYVPEAEQFDFQQYNKKQHLYDKETLKSEFNKYLNATTVYGVGYETPLVNNLDMKQKLFGYWIGR